MNNSNKGDNFKLVSACIERISPLISVKLSKEVQEITKFFKNLKTSYITKAPPKLYT